MILHIEPASATPPYEQLKQQVVALIDSGQLAVGDKLPSVRRLAGDLGLAPNTVARAYRELEAAGVVHTAGRNGTVVAPRPDEGDVHAQAQRLATDFVRGMKALGLGLDDMLAYVRRA